MSYKIVATIARRGGVEITLCPSAWEENGELAWPPQMVTRLQRDPDSQPEPHWQRHACEIKKSGISSYDEALEWEMAFQNVDTDAESELLIRKPRNILKQLQNPNNNFDSMFEGIENLQHTRTSTKPVMVVDLNARSSILNTPSPKRVKTNIMPNQEKSMPSSFSPSLNKYPSPCLMDLPLKEIQNPNNNYDNMFQGTENLELASTKPVMVVDLNTRSSIVNTPGPTRTRKTNIVPNLEKPMQSCFSPSLNKYLIPKSKATSPSLTDFPELQFDLDSQVEIKKKLESLQADVSSLHQQLHVNTAKIMTMLDNIMKMASKKKLVEQPERVLDDDILEKYIFPLTEITILKDMDRELSQEKYFTRMVKHFGSVFGTDGQGRGDLLGKKMAELIMTRDLMTKMSWTGVSRTAEFQRKFAFQTLENVVKLFYKVLLKADSRWSQEKNEKLFSGSLLKHAKKRAIAEKEKVEKKKKQTENLTQAENDTDTPPEISATEAGESAVDGDLLN